MEKQMRSIDAVQDVGSEVPRLTVESSQASDGPSAELELNASPTKTLRMRGTALPPVMDGPEALMEAGIRRTKAICLILFGIGLLSLQIFAS